jgi:hypothetical protein
MKKIQRIFVVILCLTAFSNRPSTSLGASSDPKMFGQRMVLMDQAKFKDWQSRWEKEIVSSDASRYCNKEMGEDMGWKVSPFLSGFYYGYLATENTNWLNMLVICADSWIRRAVKEPDGYLGWPKAGAAGTDVDHLDDFYADSLLGEAMILRPVVLTSIEILKNPALKEKYGAKAESYIKLSEQIFEKWDRRGAWRDTEGGGVITVVLPFGIDEETGRWTDGYQNRDARGSGYSHPDNKANLVACWLLAMFDATQNMIYKERAEKWFRLMKSRMKLNNDGLYQIWSYWQPAGPWDHRLGVIPKHWIGVHPNAGYYDIDVDGIMTAYEHGLIFTEDDISHLIATSLAGKRYWHALVPYNNAIQLKFEDNHQPDSWGGLMLTPWYLALQARIYRTGR